MGYQKNIVLECQDDPDLCRHCGAKAVNWHHEPPRSAGNTTRRGNVPLCRACHIELHSERGDFAVWGRVGGQRTAQNPANWQRNLKQYKRA